MSLKRIAVILSLLAVSAISLWAAPPALINYQGRLIDGATLVNGQVSLSLRLFNGANVMVYEDSTMIKPAVFLYGACI